MATGHWSFTGSVVGTSSRSLPPRCVPAPPRGCAVRAHDESQPRCTAPQCGGRATLHVTDEYVPIRATDGRAPVAGSDRAGPPTAAGGCVAGGCPPRRADSRARLTDGWRCRRRAGLCMGAARRGATGAWQAPHPVRVPWGGLAVRWFSHLTVFPPRHGRGRPGRPDPSGLVTVPTANTLWRRCVPNPPWVRAAVTTTRGRVGLRGARARPTAPAGAGQRRGVPLFVSSRPFPLAPILFFFLVPPPSLGHSHLASSSAEPPRRRACRSWCRQAHKRPPRQRRDTAQRGAARAGSVCRPRARGGEAAGGRAGGHPPRHGHPPVVPPPPTGDRLGRRRG